MFGGGGGFRDPVSTEALFGFSNSPFSQHDAQSPGPTFSSFESNAASGNHQRPNGTEGFRSKKSNISFLSSYGNQQAGGANEFTHNYRSADGRSTRDQNISPHLLHQVERQMEQMRMNEEAAALAKQRAVMARWGGFGTNWTSRATTRQQRALPMNSANFGNESKRNPYADYGLPPDPNDRMPSSSYYSGSPLFLPDNCFGNNRPPTNNPNRAKPLSSRSGHLCDDHSRLPAKPPVMGQTANAVMGQVSERMLVRRKESRFGEAGSAPGQLDSPHGFCLGFNNSEIIVADTMNNRIQIFELNGTLLMSWGTGGYRKGRLWQPRKVAYIKDSSAGRVVVSDKGREGIRLQIFSRSGDFVRLIRQNRGSISVGLTVFENLIVAIENSPSTCIVLTQDGSLIFQFRLDQVMKEPSDVVVVKSPVYNYHPDYPEQKVLDQQILFYICDFLGHCVCVFDEHGSLVKKIGSHAQGIIFFPNGIDVDTEGDVLVADTHGNRFHVSVWKPDGDLLADYELPHMKVSRCCGLFMNPEGNLITTATNNNIVLITNRLVVDPVPSTNQSWTSVTSNYPGNPVNPFSQH